MTSAPLGVVRRHRFVIPLQLAAVIVGASCVGAWTLWSQRDEETSLDKARRTGEIRVGYAVEPPYAYVTQGATVTGESPEIVKVIATRLGIPRIVWVQTTFDALIPGLEQGRFDLIAAGMHITKPRAARIAFTRPTFRGRAALLVLRGNPHGLHSCQDVNSHPEVQLAALAGAVEVDDLHTCGIPSRQLLIVPDAITGLAAVESHLADGLALTETTIRWMVKNNPQDDLEIVVPFASNPTTPALCCYGAFALRQSDQDLLDACNRVLEEYIGSPPHRELVADFGFDVDNLPGSVSVEELLR
ncbi:MAG: ectoine/hydroxyectoine ABC transporter substrate-binding protein EhuB [Planctomycetaceae bacterium]|nr:ectoine/hydroxyectoine ABC transporter substrate-binding protein EhuB [Planctomycetaceae bacterium]